ncbi:uncharacterized protein MEPE_00375 [Melanopsichium pennsylvanicum]|uniref:JmjC domain-containing protein n=2 Tax=Melanopsichium pennsylvanicum TaxID=63383 RepID=A0AAJ4XGL8_9BASI|nr:clavaminate synthase-like protein [Melanopsichium pennsylvanicum 4]SNX81670.1 uncharacterized protein MEPE_00375 [Melanopsichium pennsylvanicum]
MDLLNQSIESDSCKDENLIHFSHAPNYTEFHNSCLLPNRPCILPPDLIANWPVAQSRAWALITSPSSSAESSGIKALINWNALKAQYGSHTAPVVITRTDLSSPGKLCEERIEMTIADAVDLIHRYQHGKEPTVHSVYIKDWHLIKQLCPTSTQPYTVPEIFADDWMNNTPPPPSDSPCSASCTKEGKDDIVDDFRFVYAGTQGSRTLLHRDVYTSYSWSSNVVGCKRWYLFPPRVISHLRRFPKIDTSELVLDIQTLSSLISTSNENSDAGACRKRKEYPGLELAWSAVQIIDQKQGETIFIPSNWYHQVENLTECISINRNWCNSVNLPSLYHSIVAELDHVQESLCDVKEMLQNGCSSSSTTASKGKQGEQVEGWEKEFYTLVQDVAIKDAGWAWDAFWNMVHWNLTKPATRSETRLRPGDAWIRDRLLPLVVEFDARKDARWLDPQIRHTALKCKTLLEAMG